MSACVANEIKEVESIIYPRKKILPSRGGEAGVMGRAILGMDRMVAPQVEAEDALSAPIPIPQVTHQGLVFKLLIDKCQRT